LDTLCALIVRQEEIVKITIEISFDGETPVVTAHAQAQAAHDASDAGGGPDIAAEPPRAAASTTGAVADAGAPKPPPFDLPIGVLVATDYPVIGAMNSETGAEDAGAPRLN
jgi:hypothetical protein